jgi:hypothetical protein
VRDDGRNAMGHTLKLRCTNVQRKMERKSRLSHVERVLNLDIMEVIFTAIGHHETKV